MSANHRLEETGEPNIKVFENYGSIYGLLLGLVVGVLIAGPHFREWPFFASLATMVGGGSVGALIGHVAIALAHGSVAGGHIGVGGGAVSGGDAGGDGGGGGGDA